MPEMAIKIVKEEHRVIVFRTTTPKGASFCPRQPVDDPFSQDKQNHEEPSPEPVQSLKLSQNPN